MTINMGFSSYVAGNDTRLWLHSDGVINIGKFCSIAQNVSIMVRGNHRGDWVTTFPFPHPGREVNPGKRDVNIGSDVWIGVGSIIIGGLDIGDGAIIGAGSVVTDDVPHYAVVCGAPSVIKKYRFDDETIKGLLELKWWNWPQTKIGQAIPLLLSPNVKELLKWEKP